MEKIKLLLYCTKSKPYLLNQNIYEFYDSKYITSNLKHHKGCDYILNGKIVAECDFEVEEIIKGELSTPGWVLDVIQTKHLQPIDLSIKSCLSSEELKLYNPNFAIHIENLKERVMELSDVYKYDNSYNNMFGWLAEENEKYIPLDKAPQNMCRVWVYENGKWIMYILISVKPEWLFLELNGEKTIEVRKRVLKGML